MSTEIVNKIQTIIQLYSKKRTENFNNDVDLTRSYLITKLMEEFGEYCEVAGMKSFLTDRKAVKYNLIAGDGKVDTKRKHEYIHNKLYKEAGDLVWMALSIAFLEGHSIETLTDYIDSRKDAANKKLEEE